MSSAAEDRRLEVLDEDECRRLLPTAVIGRLAFTEGALPVILPVAFGVHQNRIVIPTRPGSKMATASRRAVVAFEADAFDPVTRTGWNVTVVGPSRVVTDAAEAAALEAFGVSPWIAAPSCCFITVLMQIIRGRRIRVGAQAGASPVSA